MISFVLVMLVVAALAFVLGWWALLPLLQWRGIRRLRREGLRRQGEVLAAETIEGGKLRVTFGLDDADGRALREDVDLVDSKPQLRRFAPGNRLDVLLSPYADAKPRLMMADARIGVGWRVAIAPLLLAALLVGGQRLFALRMYQAGGELAEMFSRGQPETLVAMVWAAPLAIGLVVALAARRSKRRQA